MSIARHTEITAESPNSFDEACQNAIEEASRTVRNITQFWVKDVQIQVTNNQITQWRVNGKLSFVVDNEDGEEDGE